MHELPLLVALTGALAYALVGGLVARRLGLPTIVGYLLAGVALGPMAGSSDEDLVAIQQMAEFGVILLMFGVGLHFSFKDLWKVRWVAIPGALLQAAASTGLGYLAASSFGFSPGGALVFGMATAVASTVVMMRTLMDYGWLDTPHGKVALGWLVFEDILTVLILVLLPALAGGSGASVTATAALALGKGVLFVALMVLVGNRVVPWLLGLVVNTRSRELFVLVALTVATGTALASAAFFDVSLALGAFVAGVVVSESEFSHQIGADLLPFREAFAVIFFVSVGMLVNPGYILEHWDQVLIVTALVVVGKAFITTMIGFIVPCQARTVIVLAACLGQVGEFSFILGQAGLALGLINLQQYSLILAGAIASITINPFVMRLVDPVDKRLRHWPKLWAALDRGGVTAPVPVPIDTLRDHVVIVGCGRVGRHIVEALGRLGITRLVVEADPARIDKLQELGVPTLYGDAGNSEILSHAELPHARALVITVPDDGAALAVVASARAFSPGIRVVSRASTWEGGRRLKAAGVVDVVRPELEGGIEIVRRTLIDLEMPLREVQKYVDLLRRDGLDEATPLSPERARVLDELLASAKDLDIGWLRVADDSPFANRSLAASGLRARTGLSVVAIARGDAVIHNPDPTTTLQAGDHIAVIGTQAQVDEASRLVEQAPAPPMANTAGPRPAPA
ncbi:MAG TPA: cation:proton antiporter [Vicinamibacterales bacterium]|nr:cation:proton antiporter [Vicinamibacterales bacterium]